LDTSQKHTKLSEIHWPVFKLGDKKPTQHEGVVFYHTHYVSELNSETVTLRVVDDRNLPQATLGLRRLALKSSGADLYPIRTAIYFLTDLIKLGKSVTWFIDSSGRVFQYEKNTRAKLQTRKVKNVLPADGLGCVIELEGLSSRFKSLRRPQEHEIYAQVLKLGMGFLFYGFCDTRKPDSWRMV
jgi:hypothetical protein